MNNAQLTALRMIATGQQRALAFDALQSAFRSARENGPLDADPSTVQGLAAAFANAQIASGQWCQCEPEDLSLWRYFERQDGRHGWICAKCRGYTQIG